MKWSLEQKVKNRIKRLLSGIVYKDCRDLSDRLISVALVDTFGDEYAGYALRHPDDKPMPMTAGHLALLRANINCVEEYIREAQNAIKVVRKTLMRPDDELEEYLKQLKKVRKGLKKTEKEILKTL